MKYCFGADVGGTTIKLGLFTVDGEILDKWEIITRTEYEGESILQDTGKSNSGRRSDRNWNGNSGTGKFGRYCEKDSESWMVI